MLSFFRFRSELIPYEDVVKEYNRDLVSCSVYLGLGSAFYRIVGLNLKVPNTFLVYKNKFQEISIFV